MLFTPNRPRRPRTPMVLTDGRVKSILSNSRLTATDTGYPVRGRIIGWKRTSQGTLGAIVVNPVSAARHLFVVDFATGRPRQIARLV